MTEIAGTSGTLIEAEDFDDYGGWVLDSQFETQMGSPYLLAHGLGRPVADARTLVSLDEGGPYRVWVRTRDWAAPHSPGRFSLLINGAPLTTEFGTNGADWSWQSAGVHDLPAGKIELALRDLTGFEGRCDAIFLARGDDEPPNDIGDAGRAWRRTLRGLPDEPVDAGAFDVVVVGGGISGCAAALAAARLGQTVSTLR